MMLQLRPRPLVRPTPPARDNKYKDWIREQGCAIPGCSYGGTDAYAIECAHTGRKGKGMRTTEGTAAQRKRGGRKACDHDCIPLCPYHHRTGPRPEAHHSAAEHVWEAHHGIDLATIRGVLKTRYLDGVAT